MSTSRVAHFYIGENDCKVATCTMRQEFPDGDDPYCIMHSLGKWLEEREVDDGAE